MLAARRPPRPADAAAGRRPAVRLLRGVRRAGDRHRAPLRQGGRLRRGQARGRRDQRPARPRHRRAGHPGHGPRRPDAADRDRARRLPRPGPHRRACRQVLDDALALAGGGLLLDRLRGDPGRGDRRVIMEHMEIPIIGIGAGPATDGQVLVFHDLLGDPRRLQPEVRQALRGRPRADGAPASRPTPRRCARARSPDRSTPTAIAPEELERVRVRAGRRSCNRSWAHRPHLANTTARAMPRLSRTCSLRASASSSTCSRRPAGTPRSRPQLLERMLDDWPDHRELAARDRRLRARGRPDHARHHPAPQPRRSSRRSTARTSSPSPRRSTTSSTTSRRSPTTSGCTGSRRRWIRRQRWPTCCTRRASGDRQGDPAAAHASSRHPPHTVEVNRLENEGDRILREALASLFDARRSTRWW